MLSLDFREVKTVGVTWCAKENDLAVQVVLLQSGSDGQCDCNSRHADEIVTAGVTDAPKGVHLKCTIGSGLGGELK
jgi:hypothetical protein